MMKDIQDFFDGVDKGALYKDASESARIKIGSGENLQLTDALLLMAESSEEFTKRYIQAYHEWLAPQLG